MLTKSLFIGRHTPPPYLSLLKKISSQAFSFLLSLSLQVLRAEKKKKENERTKTITNYCLSQCHGDENTSQ